MNWKISHIFLIGLLLISCKKEQTVSDEKDHDAVEIKIANTKYLIEATELQELQKEKTTFKIIDFRKKKNYLEEHIPNALNIWRSDIEDATYPYKGMMAKKEALELLFSSLGIQNQEQLIVYDDKGSCDAIRFWWVMQQYGFDNMKILNGGLAAWKAINGMVNQQPPSITPSTFKLNSTTEKKGLFNKDNVLNSLESNNTIIIDTRDPDEFYGVRQKKGASKAGRIPNSKLINWIEAIDYNGTKKLKSVDALKEIYGNLGVSKSDTIIVYCHTGVRSAHTFFVLQEVLGYKNVKNYDGSWSEWSYFNDLPFVKDSITTTTH